MWAGLLLLLSALLFAPAHAHFGSCEDHTPRCSKWSSQGLCDTSRQFMLQNCPVSCDTCLDPGCFDRSRSCSVWARRGFCKSHREEMMQTCPHSCDLCLINPQQQLPLSQRKTITRPDFECGKGVPASRSSRTARQITFPDDKRLKEKDRVSIFPLPGLNSQAGTQSPSDALIMLPGQVDKMIPISVNEVQVDDTFCGATLISDHFLLTAAHCVIDPDRPVRTVRLGELDFAKDNEENSRPVDYAIQQIIVHPDFDPNSRVRYNDVALLQTVEKIEFNEVVFPYCLSAVRPAPKTLVIGAGFGLVNATTRVTRLQEAELELKDTSNCESIYLGEGYEPQLRLRYPQLLQNRDIICAAHPERDACEGDSGGPLFRDEGGRRFLVGVVGSGVSCRGSGISVLPGLYISVADHIDFIDSVVYGDF